MRRCFRFADPFFFSRFSVFSALRHQTERSTQSGSGGWLRQWREKNKIDVARSAHGVKNHSREPAGEVTSLSSPAGGLESTSKASANKGKTLKSEFFWPHREMGLKQRASPPQPSPPARRSPRACRSDPETLRCRSPRAGSSRS